MTQSAFFKISFPLTVISPGSPGPAPIKYTIPASCFLIFFTAVCAKISGHVP